MASFSNTTCVSVWSPDLCHSCTAGNSFAFSQSYCLMGSNEVYAYAMYVVALATSLSGLFQVHTLLNHVAETPAVDFTYWFLNFVQNAMWGIYGMMLGDIILISSSVTSAFIAFIVVVIIQVWNKDSFVNQCANHCRAGYDALKTTSGTDTDT